MRPLLAVAALAAAAAASWSAAQANFAAADGFSGIAGATCTSCHADPHPLQGDARAVLEGLPDAWEPGQAYALTIRVEGGPTPMPAPAPQGGFEVAATGGVFAIPAGSESILRQPHPWSLTYRPEGTLQRAWQVLWVAPSLSAPPATVDLYLAVLAANGNHVILTNTSDSGEKLDSADSLHVAVPPAPGAEAAWLALPLAPPTASGDLDGRTWTVAGRHADANATHLGWRLDDGPWQRRPTGPAWRLVVEVDSSGHVLELRSEGAGRASPATAVAVQGGGPADPADVRESPDVAPAILALALAGAAILRRDRP